ncbi:MAG: hypothetical protein K8T90_18700 [Planctomycetes bacterium]|nr:hypothetical protein [Planctomycetota bacterium]
MAGVQTPVVMLPRYSCYSGADDFITIAMDVTAYVKATMNVWRSPLVGTTPTFAIAFEESTDQNSWSACAVSGTPFPDPGADSETQYTATFTKRWFRVKVTLGGTAPVATCWCVGFFEERES